MKIEEYKKERDRRIFEMEKEHCSVDEISRKLNVDDGYIKKLLKVKDKKFKIKKVFNAAGNRMNSWN